MEKIESKDWIKEYITMVEQGYLLIEEDGKHYWIKNENNYKYLRT